jgi:glycosyltransferase involved in cell wall biosynthesis
MLPLADKSFPLALVFIPSCHGGIATYATEQARELSRRGWRVHVLATNVLKTDLPTDKCAMDRRLFYVPDGLRSKGLRFAAMAASILLNHAILALQTTRHRPDVVLVDGYSELIAPLWAWMHWMPKNILGVCYAVTIHDPERRAVFGPKWWHRLSVKFGYSPFSVGLVHGLETIALEWRPAHLELRDAPHGVFTAASKAVHTGARRDQVRRALGVHDPAKVMLAFGYVADRKNLDFAIRALAEVPAIHLVVAGRPASARDRPVGFYRELAGAVGVGDRVHFIERHVTDEEVPDLFEAADAILLTYNSNFVSQSGVLHLAANWDKPVLASSGPGPLREAVRRHGLGIVVEADSVDALVGGFLRLIADDLPSLGWESFRQEASWERNIDLLLDAVAAAKTICRSHAR